MKSLLLGLVSSFALASAPSAHAATHRHPTIVLVHGAFETASVWTRVEARLRHDGFRTISVNLPGRPGNPLEPAKASLNLYRDTVLAQIVHERRPVVLVGHSFGGMTISAVAEAAPTRIRTLVYVAAYLPKSGDSLLSLSQTDRDSKMGSAFRVSADKTSASVDPAQRGELFCNDCSLETKADVAAGIVDEPLAPPATPLSLTAERYGVVHKVYVHTARDVVVSPSLQAAMVKATPVGREMTLDTGHAPFAKAPIALAKAIEQAVR